MEDDAAMLIPQNRNPSAGRAGTPSKTGGTPTPQRTGSAPRATSSGRGAARGSIAVVEAVKRCVTATPNRGASRSGAISRRKLRKWEMDNLFGIGKHATRGLFDDMDDEGGVVNFGLAVDWRCLFSELFRGQNEEARASFLSCEDSVYEAPRFKSRFSKLADDVQAGEAAWLRVPRKLRPVLQRAVESDEDCVVDRHLGPVDYIRALESVIFYFLDTGYPAPVATLPAALSERLAEPIQLKEAPAVGRKDASGSEDEDGWVHVSAEETAKTPTMGLEIVLEDSPLHRLMLYAIVQFHGLQTRSYDSDGQRCDNGVRQQKKNNKKSKKNGDGNKKAANGGKKDTPKAPAAPNNNRKAILIYRGKNALTQTADSTAQPPQIEQPAAGPKRILSLVSYLQYKQKQRDDSRMQLLLQQLSLSN